MSTVSNGVKEELVDETKSSTPEKKQGWSGGGINSKMEEETQALPESAPNNVAEEDWLVERCSI
jgi:hypothetical protein